MPTFEELNRDLLEGPRDTSRSFARQQAVSQLVKLGDARARETLLALLRDSDRAIRTQAIESLARYVDGKVLFAVTQALKDRDAEVRRVAAKFLGEVGDEASVHELEGAAEDESWFVQYECKGAIERIKSRARSSSAKARVETSAAPVAQPAPAAEEIPVAEVVPAAQAAPVAQAVPLKQAPPLGGASKPVRVVARAAAPSPSAKAAAVKPDPVPFAQLAPEPAKAAPSAGPSARTDSKGGSPRPPLPSDDDILRHVAARLATPAKKGKNGASFSIPIDDKRKQTVQVLFERNGKPPREYVVFFTECGPAEPMRYEYALRNNVKMHFGAIGVTDRGGKPFFVLFDVVPRETVTPDVAAEIARKVARHGDAFEKTLSPEDKY